MDDIEKWVKESIAEELEIGALVQKEIERMQNTRVFEGRGLSSKDKEFVEKTRQEFPEFIWEWNGGDFEKSVVVNLLASEGGGLPKEDYLAANMRVLADLDVNTRDISKARIEEFVTFAANYGISVILREVAELQREVIRRVNKWVFDSK